MVGSGAVVQLLQRLLADASRWAFQLGAVRAKSTGEENDSVASGIRGLALQLHSQLQTLTKPGQMLLFPAANASYTKNEDESVLLVFTCEAVEWEQSDGKLGVVEYWPRPVLSLLVCSAGMGARAYHPSSEAVPPLVKLRPCVLIAQVLPEKLDRAW
jgi:hypothetical protein